MNTFLTIILLPAAVLALIGVGGFCYDVWRWLIRPEPARPMAEVIYLAERSDGARRRDTAA